jgi:hypothetical protein
VTGVQRVLFRSIQLTLLDVPESERFRSELKYNLPPLTDEEKEAFKVRPFDHQLAAIDFMLQGEKTLLLDGCGVGKTNEMI